MALEFRVWAPDATTAELAFASERIPMAREPNGWWAARAAVDPEIEYRYALDGGEPLPDPRSPWQPSGVNGPSRLVEHDAFHWSDASWRAQPLSSAVIYELHTGTFTPQGTFEAAIEKLDYLCDLGVTHVELMPVNEFSGERGWGYDGVDLFAPHHAYGGPEGLKRLVNACHEKGLAALLDVVYNHLGPSGNYLARFGPYFTNRYATPWGSAVNLDGPYSHEVRRFFCDNACMWLRDYHFDGLRLDAVHAILDTSAVHLLEQMAEEVERLQTELGRPLVLIAESDLNDRRVVRPRLLGGYGIDAQWSDDFHHALHTVLTGERSGYYEDFDGFVDLATALKQAFVYDWRYSPHRRRFHGSKTTGLSGHQFLGYIQNHDQVGNRALGERMTDLAGLGRLKVAAAIVLTSPFVPMLFQGEEWGASTPFLYFTGHEDADLGRAVSQGRQREFEAFGWDADQVPDPQERSTFERSKLKWEEITQTLHAELLTWHRDLIRLRRSTPALLDGRMDNVETRFDQASGWFMFQRGPISVVCNLGQASCILPFEGSGSSRLILASEPACRLDTKGVSLPPDSVAIVDVRGGV